MAQFRSSLWQGRCMLARPPGCATLVLGQVAAELAQVFQLLTKVVQYLFAVVSLSPVADHRSVRQIRRFVAALRPSATSDSDNPERPALRKMSVILTVLRPRHTVANTKSEIIPRKSVLYEKIHFCYYFCCISCLFIRRLRAEGRADQRRCRLGGHMVRGTTHKDGFIPLDACADEWIR